MNQLNKVVPAAMGLPDMGLPDDIQSEELFFHLRAKGNEIGNEIGH